MRSPSAQPSMAMPAGSAQPASGLVFAPTATAPVMTCAGTRVRAVLADWDLRLFSKEIIKMGRQARAVVDRLRCKSPVESNAYVHEQERPKADEPDQSGGNGCDCDVGRHDAKPDRAEQRR